MGLILVKELLMVDEDAGVHIRDLRLRELPFMRQAPFLCQGCLGNLQVGSATCGCTSAPCACRASRHEACMRLLLEHCCHVNDIAFEGVSLLAPCASCPSVGRPLSCWAHAAMPYAGQAPQAHMWPAVLS